MNRPFIGRVDVDRELPFQIKNHEHISEYKCKTLFVEELTVKNLSQSFSNGKVPGVKNKKASLELEVMKGGVLSMCLTTARAATSASLSFLTWIGSHEEEEILLCRGDIM